MKESDIQQRMPLEKLIPAWHDLAPERRDQIEAQINQEWWIGYYAGIKSQRLAANGLVIEMGP